MWLWALRSIGADAKVIVNAHVVLGVRTIGVAFLVFEDAHAFGGARVDFLVCARWAHSFVEEADARLAPPWVFSGCH